MEKPLLGNTVFNNFFVFRHDDMFTFAMDDLPRKTNTSPSFYTLKDMKQLKIKRVYEAPEEADGYRILTDKLWPRGLKKEQAAIDEWAKAITPTTSLRQWFGHKPEKFQAFADKYRAELNANADAPAFADHCQRLLEETNVTLLYGARDPKCNHAIVLRQWILGQEK